MGKNPRWRRHPLGDRKVIVTGCASGIGRETARLLRRMGAHVIGVDRTKTKRHVDAFHRVDLADPAAVDDLCSALPKGAHGLANIAGVPPTAPPEQVLAINFVALKRLTEGLAPRLAEGASVVNLASVAGCEWRRSVPLFAEAFALEHDGVPDFVARHAIDNTAGHSYRLSKELVIGWTMQSAWRWRARGIRMNSVSPGPVATPILDDFMATLGERAAEGVRVVGRAGTPMDIAPVVAFLLTDLGGWMSGTDVPVDGGLSAFRLGKELGF